MSASSLRPENRRRNGGCDASRWAHDLSCPRSEAFAEDLNQAGSSVKEPGASAALGSTPGRAATVSRGGWSWWGVNLARLVTAGSR